MATATYFGALKEFIPESESIKSYLERVELYFTANSVQQNKRVPILLSSIGSTTYSLLSGLVAPTLPKDKSFAEIKAVLQKHFEPKRAIIAERFHFHKRDQSAGESVAEYDAALRKLATHCKFGNYLEEALRDRFVCGLRNEGIQRRLLAETELPLTKAMEMALSMESADKNTRSFKGLESAIKRVHGKPPRTAQPCSRCGKSNHTPSECKFKDAECHACGKKGHIAPVCRSKQQQQPRTQRRANQFTRRSRTQPQATHIVQRDQDTADTSDSEAGDFYLFKMNASSSSSPIEVQVTIEGKI